MSLPVPEVWFLYVKVLQPDKTPFTTGRVYVYDVYDGVETQLNVNAIDNQGVASLTWNKNSFQQVDSTRQSPILKYKVTDYADDILYVSDLFYYPSATQESEATLVDTSGGGGSAVWDPTQPEVITDDLPCIYGTLKNHLNLPIANETVVAKQVFIKDGLPEINNLESATTDSQGKFKIPYLLTDLANDVSKGNTIYLSVVTGEEEQVSETVLMKTVRYRLDIIVKMASNADNSEFTKISSKMEDLLGDKRPSEEYLQTEVNTKLLANMVGFPVESVLSYLQAYDILGAKDAHVAQYNDENGDPDKELSIATINDVKAEFFFALAKEKIEITFYDVLEYSSEDIFNTVSNAIANDVIPKIVEDNLSDVLDMWRQVSISCLAHFPIDLHLMRYFRDAFGSNSHLIREVIKVYLDHEKDLKEIRKVAKDIAHASVDADGLHPDNMTNAEGDPISGTVYEDKLAEYYEKITERESLINKVIDTLDFADDWVPGAWAVFIHLNVNEIGFIQTWDHTKWVSVAYQAGVNNIQTYSDDTSLHTQNYPKSFPGKDVTEQEEIYATYLEEKAKDIYLQDTFIQTIISQGMSADTGSFMDSEFAVDLDSDDAITIVGKIASYVEAIDPPLTPEQAEALKNQLQDEVVKLQRVYRITSDEEQASHLISQNLDSSYSISRIPENEFVAQHYKELGGFEEARKIHRVATHHASEILFKIALNQEGLNLQGEAIQAIPRVGFSSEFMVSADPEGLITTDGTSSAVDPKWEVLFGNMVQCSCGHCQSIYSAAAYFVDLLQYLPANMVSQIKKRRQDLFHVELTCSNTNTILPYIDLAIEVLEASISEREFSIVNSKADWLTQLGLSSLTLDGLPNSAFKDFIDRGYYLSENAELIRAASAGEFVIIDSSWRYTLKVETIDSVENILVTPAPQTSWSSAKCEAYPEHINYSTYDILKTSNYPLNLPFDLWYEEQKASLKPLGISRSAYLSVFNANTTLLEISREYFGLNDQQTALLVSNTVNDSSLWGLESVVTELPHPEISGVFLSGTWIEVMSVLPVFMNRSGLSQKELSRVLETQFVGEAGGGDPIFMLPENEKGYQTCETNDTRIVNLSSLRLNRANRFIRLINYIDWTIEELDAFLSLITPAAVDTINLEQVYQVNLFLRENDIALPEFLAMLDGVGLEGAVVPEDKTSLYTDLFLKEEYPESSKEGFQTVLSAALGLDITGQVVPKYDSNYLSIIARSFSTKEADLQLAFKFFGIDPETTDVELNSVSGISLNNLFRWSLTSKILNLSLEEFLTYFAFKLDSFSGSANPDWNPWAGQTCDEIIETTNQEKKLLLRLSDVSSSFGVLAPLSSSSGLLQQKPDADLLQFFTELDEELEAIRNSFPEANLLDPAVSEDAEQIANFRSLVLSNVSLNLAESFEISPDIMVFIGSKLLSSIDGQNTAIDDWDVFREAQNIQAIDNNDTLVKSFRNFERLSNLVKMLNLNTGILAFWHNQDEDGTVLTPPPLGTLNLTDFLGDSPAFSWTDWETLVTQVSLYQNSRIPSDRLLELWVEAGQSTLTSSSLATEYDFSDDEFTWILNQAFSGAGGFSPSLFAAGSENWYLLNEVYSMIRKSGLSTAELQTVVLNASSPTNVLTLRKVLQNRFGATQWFEKAAVIRNSIREAQRDALVAYILFNEEQNGQRFKTTDEMYSYFLIDPQMNSDVKTSRIKRAISSIQQLVQRTLLDLEPACFFPQEKRDLWVLMKNYRVWEANRKVFLYPENWLEPELRDDKTPFFKEMEEELEQVDLTDEAATKALNNYLEKIRSVSNLAIMGAYRSEADKEGYSSVLHVFGRSHSLPYQYYYRKFYEKNAFNGVWTPWEKVETEINSPAVFPVMNNGRLYLFWPTYNVSEIRKNEGDPSPNDTTNEGWYTPRATRKVDITLNWSEYQNSKWTPAKMTDEALEDDQNYFLNFIDPSLAGTFYNFRAISSNADYIQIEVYATEEKETETDDDGNWIFATQTHGHLGNILIWRDGASATQYIGAPKTTPTRDFYPMRSRLIFNGSFESTIALDRDEPDYHSLKYPKGNKLLGNTPGDFWVMPTNLDFLVTNESPYFYAENGRTYFVQNVSYTGKPAFSADLQKGYKFSNVSHPLIHEFQKRMSEGGLPSLMARDTQALPAAEGYYYSYNYYNYYFNVYLGYYIAGDWRAWDLAQNQFEITHLPKETVALPYPVDTLEWDYGSSMGIYNWELFFHAPLYIAQKLSQNQKFEDAFKWFHSIFNPEGKLNNYEIGQRWAKSLPRGARFWNFLPFFANRDAELNSLETLGLASTDNPRLDTGELDNLIDEWKMNPFNPHLIARHRIVAYQKSVVMKYLDNLIEWGDSLFRKDTIESINEALQVYILAHEILEKKPESSEPLLEKAPLSYHEFEALEMDAFSNIMTSAESALLKPAPQIRDNFQRRLSKESESIINIGVRMLYFCTPRNDNLLHYWDVVADRLFKIRNSMNLSGAKRQLALFAPPIDPGMLVKAAAAGLDLGTVLADMNAPSPIYRYRRLFGKSVEICQEVKSLASQIVSALEKKDAESLSVLRSKNEIELLELSKEIRDLQTRESEEAIESLRKSRLITEEKRNFYRDIENQNAIEKLQASSMTSARNYGESAHSKRMMGSILAMYPDFNIGALIGLGGGPLSYLSFGGTKLSAVMQFLAAADEHNASNKNADASMAGLIASQVRRWADWKLQERLADKELEQIDQQIVAAEIRKEIAEKEYENVLKQIEHSNEVLAFLETKYTNIELYNWLLKETTKLHTKMYQLAFNMARKAEKAYQFELGLYDSIPTFISSGNWDNLHKGLLAGERLMSNLQHMDVSYLDNHKREQEVIKTFSLAEFNYPALNDLKKDGLCNISIPEWIYDLDFPGQYMRRIKSVKVTIPCVAGPHTNINARLKLTDNLIRTNTGAETDYYSGLTKKFNGTPQVSISKGISDSGMFELNFNDERYLPFEGAGASSSWSLELPKTNDESGTSSGISSFDYSTITDVVFEISYTAREDSTLKNTAKAALDGLQSYLVNALAPQESGDYKRVISLKNDFPDVYRSLLSTNQASLDVQKNHFPYLLRDLGLSLDRYALMFKTKDNSSLGDWSASFLAPDADGALQSLSSGEISGDNTDPTGLESSWVATVENTSESGKILSEENMSDVILTLTYSVGS